MTVAGEVQKGARKSHRVWNNNYCCLDEREIVKTCLSLSKSLDDGTDYMRMCRGGGTREKPAHKSRVRRGLQRLPE